MTQEQFDEIMEILRSIRETVNETLKEEQNDNDD